ncbi:hypothetical protein [Paucibacter sp. Y2R2-4]|uniref:hypothetical protein n=1 Tax=Paucibacter sp. Y2R2-4 TaxID=2893553 RepID=UPI0021E39FDC|nr:hypothetical protein [Paucibacter sp. Y2R2-4]MCV2348300.1 hypothetical protein [Paucibacter sp. Y2R2-4]
MSLNSVLQAVQDSPVGQLLRGSDPLVVIAFQLLHIIGLLVLLTAVLLLTLRLFNLGLRQQSPQEVAQLARPLQRHGLLTVVISGAAMFVSNAVVYAANPALQLKLLLLLLAVGLQASLTHLLLKGPVGAEKPATAESEQPAHDLQSLPALARVGALASLLLWTGTGLAGRAIGFI